MDALAPDQLKEDFRIRVVAQLNPGRAQLIGEAFVAINLAIEDERITSIRINPRLGAPLWINDGKPGMPECNPGIYIDPVSVWPAMRCPISCAARPL